MKVKIKSYNGELPDCFKLDEIYILDNVFNMDGGYIYTDDGCSNYISLNDCAYLNGGSWEVVE